MVTVVVVVVALKGKLTVYYYKWYHFFFSFSPTDNKFASCSDDGLVKIWDFYRCTEERVLRGKLNLKCLLQKL